MTGSDVSYAEQSPSRQVRLHRRVAEALERAYGSAPSPAQAAEIAAQYHRSRSLPGAERGVEPALDAVERAEATAAYDTAARLLRRTLDLLPGTDARRPRLLGRRLSATTGQCRPPRPRLTSGGPGPSE